MLKANIKWMNKKLTINSTFDNLISKNIILYSFIYITNSLY